MIKNVFTYWQGPKPELIVELEQRLQKVCRDNSYNLFELSDKNIRDYISLPEEFSKAEHIMDITDFIRIKLLVKYGGVWVDKDVLAIKEFDHLFGYIEEYSGFVVGVPTCNRIGFNNAILGSSVNSHFYQKWEKHNDQGILEPRSEWPKLPFGNHFLKKSFFQSPSLGVKIVSGVETRMEYFINSKSKKLLCDIDPSVILEQSPSLVHFFSRNCRKYNAMSKDKQKSTLLYKLLDHTKN